MVPCLLRTLTTAPAATALCDGLSLRHGSRFISLQSTKVQICGNVAGAMRATWTANHAYLIIDAVFAPQLINAR